MLYSQSLEPYTGILSEPIESSLEEVKEYFSLPSLNLLSFDANHIVVPVTYTVSIPPKGTVGGIDIRDQEPVLIKISLERYPDEMPLLLSDRKDFPKKHLAHLYASINSDDPAKFCLVRNSVHEWFAGKRMIDFLAVGEQWLFKAAIGRLSDDGEEFDPTRLEGYCGYHIFKYGTLNQIVKKDHRFLPNLGMAVLLSYAYNNENELTYKSLAQIPALKIKSTYQLVQKISSDPKNLTICAPLFSLLVWDEEDEVKHEYLTELPQSYGALRSYLSLKGVQIDKIMDTFVKAGLNIKTGILLIHAVKRPKKMIGYDGQYEFLNFVISAESFKSGFYPDDAKVFILSHIEPFSKELANRMSGEERSTSTLFIGAGSLGSKIIMHDARSGKINIGIVDDDKFLQHNLARHTLFQNRIGQNKADALLKEVSELYELDDAKKFKAYPTSVIYLPAEEFVKYDWIVDTSASFQVQNWLTNKKLHNGLRIARCELVDDGRLGLLYTEGNERNPRLDDLICLTYYKAVNEESLQTWRERDSKREPNNIDIGLGCSSTTTVLADDLISLHAAAFSRLLSEHDVNSKNIKEGLIFLSKVETAGIPNLASEHFFVKPFESYFCNGGSGWEVRFLNGLSAQLLQLCKQNGNIETGGVLVGLANYKTKTIHIFEIIEEPQDSKGTCTGFQRGIKGLPEKVNQIKEKTGEVIGYIGEWHSHPMNLESLSARDTETIEELVKINRIIPIPTCAIIVTKEKVLPYVFL